MDEDPVVAIGAARTAIGSYCGQFRDVDAYELGAVCIREALARAEVDPEDVDDVVMGCIGQVGSEILNARRASLLAGVPVTVPAYNVNRLCGSGLQAIWNGTAEILLGDSEIVVAGGNESMSRQPFLDFSRQAGTRLGNRTLVDGTMTLVTDAWGNYPMGVTAENVADRFGVSREAQDEFALGSQRKTQAAIEAGIFADEIVPVEVDGTPVQTDEHPRPNVTMEKLGSLRPAFRDNGSVTAGNSSGINDGAAAVVLMRESQARRRGLRPLARLVGVTKAALEPEIMGYAPTIAIDSALSQVGIERAELDVVELNEAFAAVAVAVMRDAMLDPRIVNPNGGAIALGHPVGATGAILTVKLIYEMRRRDLTWGLVTMCIGGGQALAAIFQNCRS